MPKLQYSFNKVLKLQNVLICKINLEDEEMNINLMVGKIQSYIKVKGAIQIGPLIQETKTFVNDAGELDMEVYFLLQCTVVMWVQKTS